MPKTKSFIVATSGDTVDGRVIEASWLTDIAATYNRATYGARVNKEHIVGLSGAEPFKAYGDVLSCSVEPIELTIGGKKEKRTALRAEIEATDDLVALTANGQKIYTSIEVAPNFANSGKAGLVGLAVTDTPASLGTEVLSFAIKHPGALPLGPKLSAAENLFTPGYETTFELAAGESATPSADSSAGLFAALKGLVEKLTKSDATPPAVVTPPVVVTPPAPANDNEFAAQVAASMVAMTTAVEKLGTELRADIGRVRADHTALATKVDTTAKPEGFTRTVATGGSGAHVTDC